MKKLSLLLILSALLNLSFAKLTIKMYNITPLGNHAFMGTIIATQTPHGVRFTPHLSGLTPGNHGFHVHVHPSCGHHGLDAGGHLDPKKTGKHLGPYNPNGHLGDLPRLDVDKQGNATLPVIAPRLTLKDIENHSLMIHAGGDNYSDTPKANGGGGERVACGVIPKS